MNYLIERLARVIYFAPTNKAVGHRLWGPYGSDAEWLADVAGRERAIDQAQNVIGNLMSRAEELEPNDYPESATMEKEIAVGWRRLSREIDTALLDSNQDPLASDALGYSARMVEINVRHSALSETQ